MSLLPSTHNNNLSPLRCMLFFAPENADGSLQAEIPMSPSAEATYSQEPEVAEYISAESGIAEKLDSTVVAIPRSVTLKCNNLSDEIKALYFIADNEPITQAAGSVTEEVSPYLYPNRAFQLGGAVNNGTGAFGATGVTATFYEGTHATARANSTPYVVGDFYAPATPNDHFYVCTQNGTSNATPPTFTIDGTEFTDGTAKFRDVGLIAIANASSADFEVDATHGRVNIPTTGAVATAISRLPASMRKAGKTLRMESAYTRAAKTFNQLQSRESANLRGALRIVEQNPKGTNRTWYHPKVDMAPTGEYALKSGTDYGGSEFTASILKPATGSAMYQNGHPL